MAIVTKEDTHIEFKKKQGRPEKWSRHAAVPKQRWSRYLVN